MATRPGSEVTWIAVLIICPFRLSASREVTHYVETIAQIPKDPWVQFAVKGLKSPLLFSNRYYFIVTIILKSRGLDAPGVHFSKFYKPVDGRLTKEFQDHLPASVVITGPAEIIDLI